MPPDSEAMSSTIYFRARAVSGVGVRDAAAIAKVYSTVYV